MNIQLGPREIGVGEDFEFEFVLEDEISPSTINVRFGKVSKGSVIPPRELGWRKPTLRGAKGRFVPFPFELVGIALGKYDIGYAARVKIRNHGAESFVCVAFFSASTKKELAAMGPISYMGSFFPFDIKVFGESVK